MSDSCGSWLSVSAFSLFTVMYAGFDSEHAGNSFDDNELSEWKNDGRLSTAWITYRLARKAVISDICLKLTGWRLRSYPLEVYAGKDKDAFGGIVEVAEPAAGELDLFKAKNGDATQNELRIVEIEFLEKNKP